MHFILEKHAFFLFFNIFGIVSKNVSKEGLSDNLIRLSESLGNLSWWWGRVSCSSLVAQDHSPRAAPSLSSVEEQSPWAPQPTAGSPCSRLSLHSQLWAYAEQALANICLQDNKPAANTSPSFAWQVGLTATMAGTWHRGGINGHGGGAMAHRGSQVWLHPQPHLPAHVSWGNTTAWAVQHLETLPLENRWPVAKRSDSYVSSSLFQLESSPSCFAHSMKPNCPVSGEGKPICSLPVSLFYVALPTSSQVNYYLTYLIIES